VNIHCGLKVSASIAAHADTAVVTEPMIIKAKLKGDLVDAIVDADKFNDLNQYKWKISSGYICRNYRLNGKSKSLKMHRYIIQAPDDKYVDHINGNKLDNRASNLRLCNRTENMRNIKVARGVSQYKGVSLDTRLKFKKWRSTIVIDKKQLCLGYFLTEEEAGFAYNTAAVQYFGEFASLNNLKE
jgi:hypothetical protein